MKPSQQLEEPAHYREQQACLAAFYALYLRVVKHLAPDEARYFVHLRYPNVPIEPEKRSSL